MTANEPTPGVPVWARKRRKPSHPLVGLVLVPLAMLGAVTAGLAVRETSFTAAGARMDGWVAEGRVRARAVLDETNGETPSSMSAAKGDEQAG